VLHFPISTLISIGREYNLVTAAAVVSIVPILIVFLALPSRLSPASFALNSAVRSRESGLRVDQGPLGARDRVN
jgi:hypothetical protein